MTPNRNDVIRWATQCKMPYDFVTGEIVQIEKLERFAALVAAAEREKVARWQIGSGYTTGHGDTIEDLLVELEWQVRESEREACAKVCEEHWEIDGTQTAKEFADAIRARGQA